MSHSNISDVELVKMYDDKVLLGDLTTYFDVSHWTIYKHLRDNNVVPNRKQHQRWSDMEDYQLIAAYIYNTTGQAYCEHVPTRSYDGIQSRLKKFRRVKGGVVR